MNKSIAIRSPIEVKVLVSFAQRIMFEHVTVQSFHRIAVRKSKKVVNNVVQINRTNDSIGISKPWLKQRELHKAKSNSRSRGI